AFSNSRRLLTRRNDLAMFGTFRVGGFHAQASNLVTAQHPLQEQLQPARTGRISPIGLGLQRQDETGLVHAALEVSVSGSSGANQSSSSGPPAAAVPSSFRPAIALARAATMFPSSRRYSNRSAAVMVASCSRSQRRQYSRRISVVTTLLTWAMSS